MNESEIINEFLAEFKGYKIRYINNQYVVVKINTNQLIRGANGYTYVLIIRKSFINKIRGEKFPRDILLKEIRRDIRDNISRFTVILAPSHDDQKYLVELLTHHNDIRQFPVLNVLQLIRTGKPVVSIIYDLLLSYPYGNFFTRLNPYSIDSIPRGKMFFGRQDIIQKMDETLNNLVIIGARRIGKTTLAHNFSEKKGNIPISALKTESNYIKKCAVVDVSNFMEIENVLWEKILNAFNFEKSQYLPFARKERGDQLIKSYLNSIEDLLIEYNGKLVIILDEVDNWILNDEKNNWTILNSLRSLSDKGRAKIILVGYETLYNIISEKHDFPLNGRFELIKLKPLNRSEVEDLIKEPLKDLRIKIDKKFESEFIEDVWELTGGRPNLVQGFCLELLTLMSDRDDKTINEADFEAVKRISTIYKSFNNSILKGGNPLARVICFIASKIIENSKNIKVSISLIIKELEKYNYKFDESEIDINLSQLDLRNIFVCVNNDQGLYQFTENRFYNLFLNESNRLGYERIITSLILKHNKQNN